MRRLAFAALVLASAGCGYAFTYAGGAPDKPTVNVVVEPLVDSTGEGWPSSVVTDRLRARLGPPRGGASEFVLTGEVTSVSTANVPVFRPGGVAAGLGVLRVRGVVRVRDRRGRSIVPDTEREGSAELVVGQQVSQTEDMRRMALERACQSLADAFADVVFDR